MIARQALGAIVLHLECDRNGLAPLDSISDVPFESGLGATPGSAVAIDTEVVEIGAPTFVDMKQNPLGIHTENSHGEIRVLFMGRSHRWSWRLGDLGSWWGGTAMEQKGEAGEREPMPNRSHSMGGLPPQEPRRSVWRARRHWGESGAHPPVCWHGQRERPSPDFKAKGKQSMRQSMRSSDLQ